MSKEGLRGEEAMGCPTFYFSISVNVIIFSVSGWLTQRCDRSKKSYERDPWYFVFLRKPFPSFCVQENSDGKEKSSFGGCQDAHSVMNLTCSPCPCFECCWNPTHHGSTEILCLWASRCHMWRGITVNMPASPLFVCVLQDLLDFICKTQGER